MTASLKTRLEGKPRHRVGHLVQVADTTDAEAALEAARRAVALLEIIGASADPERVGEVAAARATQEAAVADLGSCYEVVWFVALPSGDMETLTASHLNDKGEIDRASLGPVLVAACAEDEDLRDADWWSEQLASDRWSSGDKDSLIDALLQLNWHTPPAALPKG